MSTGSRAAERTALSWNRSGLAVATIGAALAKAGAEGGHPAIGAIAAGLLLVLALAVWWFGNTIYADRHRERPLDPDRQRTALRLICGVSVASAVLAFALALLS